MEAEAHFPAGILVIDPRHETMLAWKSRDEMARLMPLPEGQAFSDSRRLRRRKVCYGAWDVRVTPETASAFRIAA